MSKTDDSTRTRTSRVRRRATLAAATVVAATALAAAPASALGQGTARAAAPAACTTAETAVTVQKLNRPVNHLLITARNTSKKTCTAHGYPYLRFGEAQSPAAPWANTKPAKPVVLAPGQSAYASVMTSSAIDDGTEGYRTSKLGVLFANAQGNGSVGRAVVLTLPGGQTYVNEPRVTYWQATVDDAVNYG
ncbi:DUF4232 domain-containing protein [Streptomyces pactum]|uniref:DUF4232 domain-containing protein n=1 Tax=Streptomyces pactum TaxID=68249 RepID=A0ABS0NUF3_9ACTN|nr:DUF4232 domain-containing protein [Streptomyces pactum]MBH5333989.1 DUF4232 domain-containing protein [Streptomyces pactum]MBH5338825.1 DUF4232 domain-containing protein [Streptomyces pactum]